MPAGSSPKREREYEKLKDDFHTSGRYGKRADEVAARIVNKQRAERGETRGAKAGGAAPSSGGRAPLRGYDDMTIAEITERLARLPADRLERVKDYESGHKNRKTLLSKVEGRLRQLH